MQHEGRACEGKHFLTYLLCLISEAQGPMDAAYFAHENAVWVPEDQEEVQGKANSDPEQSRLSMFLMMLTMVPSRLK